MMHLTTLERVSRPESHSKTFFYEEIFFINNNFVLIILFHLNSIKTAQIVNFNLNHTNFVQKKKRKKKDPYNFPSKIFTVAKIHDVKNPSEEINGREIRWSTVREFSIPDRTDFPIWICIMRGNNKLLG